MANAGRGGRAKLRDSRAKGEPRGQAGARRGSGPHR